MSEAWNIDEAKRLYYDEGHSASQVARHFGVTRNTIIGRLRRRFGTMSHEEAVRRQVEGRHQATRIAAKIKTRTRAAKPHPKHKPPTPEKVEPMVKTNRGPLSLLQLTATSCRWPVNTWRWGEADNALFCGEPHVIGSAYCAKHQKIAAGSQQPAKRLDRLAGR